MANSNQKFNKQSNKVLNMNKEDYLKAPNFLRTSNSQPKNHYINNSGAKRTINSNPKSDKSTQQMQNKSRRLFDMLNLNNIEMDSDRSMLLMMLALLSGKDSEADELLMMALMYIML